MKNRKYRFVILGVAVLCVAANSPALTLGRARGSVLVGQPLKLTVPIRAEPEEGASALCFEADVYYGDTQQDVSRVSVNSDFSPVSFSGNVYVTADPRVDEPVVTVYLRSGCQHKTTRRYVLLADVDNESVLPILEPSGQTRSVAPAVKPFLPPALAEANAGFPRVMPGKKMAPVRSARPNAMETASALASKPIAPRRSHLKLAPLDLTIDRDPVLKLSNELHVGDGEDLQKRAEAVALWRALNASPQDILGAESRRLAMESDLKGLQLITTKNQQTLQELTGRLNKAESERYFNPLVFGLVALLLACSAALAYAWMRMRVTGPSMGPWWRNDSDSLAPQWNGNASADQSGAPSIPAKSAVEKYAPPPELVAKNAPASPTDLDGDIQRDEPVSAQQRFETNRTKSVAVQPTLNGAPSRATGHVDFAHSVSASLRALNTQEMLDVRQQAEFFMTLGQHEEAVGLLKDSLDRSADSNPLVYLDLLKVLHTLGRKVEYDQYRAEFNALFTGYVPPYAEFNQAREGLESSPDVCQAICARWPSQKVVDYIEASMVRAPGQEPVRGFELEAFRDLLLLHSIAQRMASDVDTGLQPFSAVRAMANETRSDPEMGSSDWQGSRTQPNVPSAQSVEPASVDLDLSEPPAGNLIDFDAADLALLKPTVHKPV